MPTPITNFNASPDLLFTPDGQPYQIDPTTGKKRFISPIEAAGLVEATKRAGGVGLSPSFADARLAKWAGQMGASIGSNQPDLTTGTYTPNSAAMNTGNPDAQGGFVHTGYEWDENSGQWKRGIDYGNLIAGGLLGTGAGSAAYGALAGPSVASEVAGVAAHGVPAGAAGGGLVGGVLNNPFTKYALGPLFDLYQGHRASNAAKQAAKAQADAADKAMAFAQQMFTQQQQNFQPYADAGKAALGRMNDYLLGQKPQPTPQSVQDFLGKGVVPSAPVSPRLVSANALLGGPPQDRSGDLVTLQGPDLSTKQMPRAEAQLWLQTHPGKVTVVS